MKIVSLNDLQQIKKKAESLLALREASDKEAQEQTCGLASGTPRIQVLTCGGTGCKASSSHIIAENFRKLLQRYGISDKIDVITTGCFGFCEKGPIVKIIPDNTFYTQVSPDDVEEIVSKHIISGNKVERLLYVPKPEAKGGEMEIPGILKEAVVHCCAGMAEDARGNAAQAERFYASCKGFFKEAPM